jgi:shikimate dehydrogenase
MRQQVVVKTKEMTGKTRICGLMGDPVEHSISPAIHNAAFNALGLEYIYVPFHVKPKDLKKAIDGMRALHIRGLNVTIPHKVAVLPFLDELDSLAEKIGAVNTIVNSDGKLRGYNSDAAGFIQALIAGGVKPEGKRVVLLGAGGAARAIAFALAEKGTDINILNRKKEMDWAEELATKAGKVYKKEFRALELNTKILKKVLADADILVNATSVGMSPKNDDTPVAADLLRSGLVVYDIVYNPVETRLLKEAKQAGARTIGGLDMLVGQGAIAFELWTGEKAPVEIMKKAAEKALGRHLLEINNGK